MEKLSPCKVNLLLNILGKRADGFHELETVMHPVALFDTIRFETAAEGISLTCSEPSLPTDQRNLVKYLQLIQDFGFKTAIDDFGAGYTSFRNLRSLAVDLVKIDGSCVENLPRSPDDQAFVRTLVELAQNFDIETVAEWVQDEETVALLAGWGVDRLQGELTGAAN